MTPDIIWYLDVFFLLSNSRQMGFSGAGPIPLSEITNYTNYFELITDDLMEFCSIVTQMDQAYLKHIQSKSEHSGKNQKPPKGTSRR